MSDPIRVSVTVSTTDPALVARAVDAFGRAVAGLALEGLTVVIGVAPDEEAL